MISILSLGKKRNDKLNFKHTSTTLSVTVRLSVVEVWFNNYKSIIS
jgi:hypothetical protein